MSLGEDDICYYADEDLDSLVPPALVGGDTSDRSNQR